MQLVLLEGHKRGDKRAIEKCQIEKLSFYDVVSRNYNQEKDKTYYYAFPSIKWYNWIITRKSMKDLYVAIKKFKDGVFGFIIYQEKLRCGIPSNHPCHSSIVAQCSATMQP